jgi:hypothetical protein
MSDAQRYRRNAAQCLTAAEQRDSPYRRLALTIAALNGLWPADHNATPWVGDTGRIMDARGRRRRQSGHLAAAQRGAS